MKREKLNIVFDKCAITEKLDSFSEDSALTNSDIARAAMNYGLELFKSAKLSMSDREFDGLVLNLQECK